MFKQNFKIVLCYFYVYYEILAGFVFYKDPNIEMVKQNFVKKQNLLACMRTILVYIINMIPSLSGGWLVI